MAAFLDNCRFNPTAGGTTDWTYSSAVTGCQTPALANAVNGRVYKVLSISADKTQWEISEGAYSSSGAGSFARTTVLYNSSGTGTAAGQSGAGTKINFSAAPQVGVIGVKEDLPSIEEDNTFTDAQKAQLKKNAGIPVVGQCVLAKSGSNIVLSPCNGNMLTINGVQCLVPDAGVSLAPTGLTVGTLYYIYATASAGVVNALEASATAYARSTTAGNKGVNIKSGDDTRTLVGMVRPITGPALQDTAAQRFVRSYFNEYGVGTQNTFSTDRTTTSTSLAEINSEIRNEVLLWSGERWMIHAGGSASGSSAGGNTWCANISIDGGTSELPGALNTIPTNFYRTPFGFSLMKTGLSEGYHYATLFGSGSAGTITFGGATTANGGCAIVTDTRR